MSYAARVKEEIFLQRPSKSQYYKAFCYGLLLFGNSFEEDAIFTTTEHISVSKLYSFAIKDIIDERPRIVEKTTRVGREFFTLVVESLESRKKLLEYFSDVALESSPEIIAFLTGVFMACGSINEPSKGYHLEFVSPKEELADFLFEKLSVLGYPPKSTARRKNVVLYYKESEPIEDLLTMLGATGSSLELMETKIYKDLRNRANRAANCDAANAEKLLKAASLQLEDIELLEEKQELLNLPAKAIEVAQLRKQQPEASLSELSKLSGMSRSAVNHKLTQISQAAAKLRMLEC